MGHQAMLKILFIVALAVTALVRPAVAKEHDRLALCDVLTGVAVVEGVAIVSGARSTVLRSQGLDFNASSFDAKCSESALSSWAAVAVPVKATWTNVLENKTSLWLLGHEGTLLKSHDAGVTWRNTEFVGQKPKQAVMDLLHPASHEPELNSGLVYAVGTRGLYAKSEDRGAHWLQQVLYIDPEWDEPEDFNLNAIVELKAGGFLVAGEAGAVYWSKDGEDWDKDFAGSEATWFGAVAMPSGGVLLYGFGGKLAHAKGYEEDWVLLESGTSSSLFSSMLLDSGELLLAGQHGELLRWSGDIGQPFFSVVVDTDATITGMAAFGSKLLLTTDHGLWSVPYSSVQLGD